MADDRFHEFHLEGKQLAFLFMTATAVVVVSFLVGVMVGRGVESVGALEPAPDVAAIVEDDSGLTVGVLDAGDADERPAPQDDYTYYERLNRPTPAPERVRGSEPVREPEPVAPAPSAGPAAAAAVESRAAPVQSTTTSPLARSAPSVSPAAPPQAVSTSNARPVGAASVPSDPPRNASLPSSLVEPPGAGFSVQVLSLTSRDDAVTAARGLESKGYRAYVQPREGRYRVRVGKYQDRDEAVSAARRLETVEKFNKPWVDR